MRSIESIDAKTALKIGLVGLGALIVGIGSARFVNYLDDVMRPKYVINGSSVPYYDPQPEWQRPTDWRRR